MLITVSRDGRFSGWTGETHGRGSRLETPQLIAIYSGRPCGLTDERDGQAHQSVMTQALAGWPRKGTAALAELTGPFGLVIWDRSTRTLVAVRDHLGLAPLYYQLAAGGITVADRLDAFGSRSGCDDEFIAEFVTTAGACADRTIWSGIRPIPPGTVLQWRDGAVSTQGYWSAEGLGPVSNLDDDAAVREFLRLLTSAVWRNLDAGAAAWAHLSGGLDSSTVASLGARLGTSRGGRTLGGAITFVDSIGNADETSFSDAVAEQYRLRNEKISDYWPWQDDGEPPPEVDQPTRDYPFYARDRQAARLIRRAGGGAVLTGVGPDQYLPCSVAPLRALVARGQLREALSTLTDLATARRDTFLRTALLELVLPMAPSALHRWRAVREEGCPDWFTRDFARRLDVDRRAGGFLASRTMASADDRARVARSFRRMGALLPGWWAQYGVDVRHPLLDRPLVEFCLQLPPRFRRPDRPSKFLLREAMKGILPEPLRTRTTKGILSPRIAWALRRERPRLAALLKASRLADLGCVDPRRMLAAVDRWASARSGEQLLLYTALSLETWLSAHSSRCTARTA